MDSRVIAEVARETLAGKLPFPKVVEILIEAGVEYYHVDYASCSKSFFSPDGDRVITPITFSNLPSIAPELNVAALKENILDSQRNGQKYYDFSVRAMKAGVQSYYAFLRGQRVTYFGRNGDHHTEWFPGVVRPCSSGNAQ